MISSKDMSKQFESFERKMRDEAMHPLAITAFERHYRQLLEGHTGFMSNETIQPVDALPSADDIAGYHDLGMSALSRTVVIKLNGGLGTSMGLDRAKSLIRVKDSFSFLDVIVRQILDYRHRFGISIPLVLMNSFATERDSLDVLARYPDLDDRIPASFLQHKVPKVFADGFVPARYPNQPELEWCPPGHGDIYVALQTSGALEAMRAHGFEYLFISNADNLGAVIDPAILGYVAGRGSPFLMEVARRTPSDTKGGHLARTRDGGLALREIAQCPAEELAEFQNIDLYRFFNTNTLWIHIPSLVSLLRQHDSLLPLHLIRNAKPLNPRDAASPKVYQLETAMGSAISLFEGSEALLVPRSRFSPVKTCDDLLAVWSDAYVLTESFQVIPNPSRSGLALAVDLDKRHYGFVDQLEERFPHGPPSLAHCTSFTVRGNVTFGRGITAVGSVRITSNADTPLMIPHGTRLEGDTVINGT